MVKDKKIKKVLVFDYDKMARAGQLFNSIQFSGANNIRMAAELSKLLDSGTVMEMEEEKKEEDKKEEDKNVDIK